MSHHEEEEKSDNYLYYIVAILSGMFIGLILDSGFIWIPILGVVGLLFAAFFLTVFVKGRGKA